MKKVLPVLFLALFLSSCAPVLRKDLMQAGSTAVPFAQLQETPLLYKGKLYILGGKIIRTRNTAQGSLIEAIYVPVDSNGYLKEYQRASQMRFLALLPRNKGFLDPEIYRKSREVTLAAEFTEIRMGKIDEVEYPYPLFTIVELYLWEEQQYRLPPYSPWYGPYPYYYSPYSYPYPRWWDDPFWRYRYPYWWW